MSRPEVEDLFRKLFKSGDRLQRLPKNPRELEIVLALAASVMDPRAEYSEPELNEILAEWMSGFTNPRRLDHVTLRRFMVDYAFVLRDTPGTSYRSNQAVISAAIHPDARSVQPHLIYESAVRERALRRRRAPG